MTCGIYFIRSKASGKMYIGSSVDIERRHNSHRHALRQGVHGNSRLSGAYAKAGSLDVFEFGVWEECAEADLHAREQYWVDKLRPNYNVRMTDVRGNKDVVPSNSARARMAAARRAYLAQPGVREKISAAMTARWADPIERAKIVAGNKASWTKERRAAAIEYGKNVAAYQLIEGRAKRWAREGEHVRQSTMMSAVRARNVRTYADIEALVLAADPQWVLRSATGTKTKDKLTVHCAKHDAVHEVTVNMLVSRQQGCRLCGWERSSAKQKGVPKLLRE
jgi:hypothetical protein